MAKPIYSVEPNGAVKKFGSCTEAATYYHVGKTTPSAAARRMYKIDHVICKHVKVRRYFFSILDVIAYKRRQGIK